MTNTDKEYIGALKLFTEALEQIIETLENQAKNNNADIFNEFLKNVSETQKLTTVVEELKKVNEKGFADVKSQNEIILKEIQSIKQQKESGSFDRIEDPKNRNKIVDGIKVVILIAAGVLALGMAFKLIGKVDFLSVVALSTAMLLMAKTYSELASIKNLTFSQIFAIASILPLMSIGLLLSGFILTRFPSVTLMQGLSLIIVGTSLGIASYFLLKSLKNVNIRRDWLTILALPIMLPLISVGLLISANILKFFPNIGIMQGLSMIILGAALGVASWFLLKSLKNVNIRRDWATILALPLILPLISIGLLLSGYVLRQFPLIGLMQGLSIIIVAAAMGLASWLLFKSIGKVNLIKSWATILLLPVILPLIALGLVLSSYVLQGFKPLKNPLEILKGTFVIGLSILFFAPTILIVGKMKLKDIMSGILAIPLIAFSIVATAWIFQLLPSEMKYPEIKWTFATGLSIAAFGLLAYGLGYIVKKQFWLGLLAVVAIAAVILAVDFFISKGEYSKSPNLDWMINTGLSIAAFGLLAFIAGFAAKSPNFWLGLLGIVAVAAVILAVDFLISLGNYNKYPSIDWLKGVGLSVISFAVVSIALGAILLTGIGALAGLAGLVGIIVVAAAILAVDKIFGMGSFNKYPNSDWMKGSGLAILGFGLTAVILGAIIIATGGIAAVVLAAGLVAIVALAAAMSGVSAILNKGTFNKYPSEDWINGVEKSLFKFGEVSIKIGALIIGTLGAAALAGGAGILAIVGIAESMLKVDSIFNQGKFDKYPSEDWVNGVVKSISLFANMDSGDGSILGAVKGAVKNFVEGVGGKSKADAMLTIARSIVEVDKIFSQGQFERYPSEVWVSSTLGAIIKFSSETENISDNLNNFKSNKDSLIYVISTMTNISKLLESSNWDLKKLPSKEYLDSFVYFISYISELTSKVNFNLKKSTDFTNSSLLVVPVILNLMKMIDNINFNSIPSKSYTDQLVNYMSNIGKIINNWDVSMSEAEKFNSSIIPITESIKIISNIPDVNTSIMKNISEVLNQLSLGIDSFMYKKTLGVSVKRSISDFSLFATGISSFVSALSMLSTLKPMPGGVLKSYTEFLKYLKDMPDIPELDTKAAGINKLAMSFLTLANSLSSVNNNLQGFNNLSKGLFLISIIDDVKFDNVLKSVDKYKNSLQLINQLPEEQTNLLSVIKGLYETVSNTNNEVEPTGDLTKIAVNDIEAKKQQQFYSDIADIRNMLYQFKDYLDKPTQAGSFHKA